MAVVEITTFSLRAGTDEPAFLSADETAQMEFFYGQPGMLRRTTARGDSGEWLALTLWWSAESADEAASRASQHPAAQALAALTDPGSITVRRYETLD